MAPTLPIWQAIPPFMSAGADQAPNHYSSELVVNADMIGSAWSAPRMVTNSTHRATPLHPGRQPVRGGRYPSRRGSDLASVAHVTSSLWNLAISELRTTDGNTTRRPGGIRNLKSTAGSSK